MYGYKEFRGQCTADSDFNVDFQVAEVYIIYYFSHFKLFLFYQILLLSCSTVVRGCIGLFDPMRQRKGRETLAGMGRVATQT